MNKKPTRSYGEFPRTPEQVAREQAVRAKFQAERPSLENLVASGEYSETVSQADYLSRKMRDR